MFTSEQAQKCVGGHLKLWFIVYLYASSFAMPFKTFCCHIYNNQHYLIKKIIGSTLFVKMATKTFQRTMQVSYFYCNWSFKGYFKVQHSNSYNRFCKTVK